MIKTIKLSDKSVRRFKSHKKWTYTTLDQGDSIVLEQGNEIPIFLNSEVKLATEQNDSDLKLSVKEGKNIQGTFFDSKSKYYNPEAEPINHDGSYQRVVYNSVKHLFYNTYGLGNLENNSYTSQYDKNPMFVFGSETGIYNPTNIYSDTTGQSALSAERRVLGDKVSVVEIPSEIFGEKIKPSSFKINDYSSPYGVIEMEDDGATNIMIGGNSFNKVQELWSGISEEIIPDEGEVVFDYSDLSHGYKLSSTGNYLLVGSPIDPSSPSDLQSGRATLYKKNKDVDSFQKVKEFYSPFTQNGLSIESQNDNTGFIVTELGNILTSSESINDNFGVSVELGWGVCAIGSPRSHITGSENNFATGHVFIYDRNKGGVENWGLINVLEGEPDSDFGYSVSTYKNYMVVGSPELNNSRGGVYVYKKTKRTKSHPWIRTSSVFESYTQDTTGAYIGNPPQNMESFRSYIESRNLIVSRKIAETRLLLKEKYQNDNITEEQYYQLLPTNDDYSYVYPYDAIWSPEPTETDLFNDVNKILFKKEEQRKLYQKSVYKDYLFDEKTNNYIPNPNHEQNELNKWASRWKITSVIGNATPIDTFDVDTECDDFKVTTFNNENLHTVGDSKYPHNEYTESPDSAVGDITWDLVGFIPPPSGRVHRFGENVKIHKNTIYITNPSTPNSECFVYKKEINKHDCEIWKLNYRINETQIEGVESDKNLSEQFRSVDVNVSENKINIKISPTTDDHVSWAYQFDKDLIANVSQDENEQKLVSGTSLEKCDFSYTQQNQYKFYSRFKKINGKEAGQISFNSGEVVKIEDLLNDDYLNSGNSSFYSKGEMEGSHTSGYSANSIGLSWKNFRENVSFVYPDVPAGTQASFMTIYSPHAKLSNGAYDPIHTIAEIGAQETLNGKNVRLIFNQGDDNKQEHFIDFIFKGTIEGTHYTLNELQTSLDFACTLPPNFGKVIDINNIDFYDPLKNKSDARFYSKDENQLSYIDSYSSNNSMAISWKNVRENVSFSYPHCDPGVKASFMTIYANEAKQLDGSYDPIYTLAEIGAQDTLNGKKVRLTINTGSPSEAFQEYHYDFIFKGSVSGTHFTISELRENFIYERTLPPNLGTHIDLGEDKLTKGDILDNAQNSKMFSKPADGFSYLDDDCDSDELALSWKNFRENVSFSYPKCKHGNEPAFMAVYSNEAKLDNGMYDPAYMLGEIGAQNTLNGKTVRLTLNAGDKTGKESYYEFEFRGTPQGTHFTLSELRENFDNNYSELPANFGKITNLRHLKFDDNYGTCKSKLFFSKEETGMSYIDPFAPDNSMALSWKNFREDISFSYPNCEPSGNPCFMTIYANNAKTETGEYDPAYILAEIGADKELNGKIVKLILNSSNCSLSDKTRYYEFIFNGSITGTHLTLNELSYSHEYDCKLPPNLGSYTKIKSGISNDYLDSKNGARFYSKESNGFSYTKPYAEQDDMALSWKNFRENVSFSYPSVKSGTQPSFMTIYSNEALKEDGTYDPIYTLAEIGAQETLDGYPVRLTMNTGSVGGDEFYFEFIYAGSIGGTHFTLNELMSSLLFIQMKDTIHIEPKILETPSRTYTNSIQKKIRTNKIKKIKSFGCIPYNTGSMVSIEDMPNDDYLENKQNACFYTKQSNSDSYLENTGYSNEIALSWKNLRENVSFTYPITNAGTTPSFMTIYSNSAKNNDGSYDPIHTLAEIGAQDTLNGELVRLTFNTDKENEHFYEFIFDGTIEGTHFTLDEIETTISTRLNLPLLVYSPFPKNCRITLDKNIISPGKHMLYVGLVNQDGALIGEQSVVTFYNNPLEYNIPDRHTFVKKRYRYQYESKKFGHSLDANDKYLIIGDPLDREFKPIENQYKNYTAGAVYVYSVSDYTIAFNKKLYGEDDVELNFNYMFGNDVSLLGNNFLVGGHAEEYSKISINDTSTGGEVSIQDLNNGALNYANDTYNTTEVLITNFEYDFDSEYGDLKIKIDKGSLDLDETKLSEMEIRADFIDTGMNSIRIHGYKGTGTHIANGVYLKANNPIDVSLDCDVSTFKTTPTYVNENGCCIFYNDQFGKWVISDKPYITDANFAYSELCNKNEVPSEFNEGVGIFENQKVKIKPKNDNIGENGFLTHGIYRGYTHIDKNQICMYVNKLTNTPISDNILFVYNVVKNAVQGYVSYYSIANDEVTKIKKIKTNKNKFFARKQFGYSVSLSTDYIYAGNPMLGDFEIDQLMTFGGSTITTEGGSSSLFMKYTDFPSGILDDFRKSVTGMVISYDHAAIRDNLKYYLGNVFYKNGILSITNTDGYFSNILNNSGDRGYEIEFKGTQTLYENEIICKVEPHEFNTSTNPTSTKKGKIPFDINEDGKFDITDVIYIYRFLMGTLVVDDEEVSDDGGIPIGDASENWPTNDLVLTESEDLLLFDMFDNANIEDTLQNTELINEKILQLNEAGEFDFDGDGIASETDAKLLIRYFMGRTGESLTNNLVDRFGNAKRKNASDIISYLNEKTGKFLGVEILDEFLNYKENDAVDKLGSYLAPYATTIGLYSGLDLVMVAKLGKPVKILPNYPINFLVKFDT